MSARPSMVEHEAEQISERERSFLPDEISETRARKHYAEVHAIAKAAAKELLDVLVKEGVPAKRTFPDGSFGGLEAVKCAQVCRLINAFAWANTRLWLAAQQLCDVANLREDGEGEGIVWEVTV